MKRKSSILISPSGNLYGSENVLFDFLQGSTKRYRLFVPSKSPFFKKLKENNFDVKGFENICRLYLKIFFSLFFDCKTVLVNEAGHIRYVNILAKLFRNRKFIVVVRIVEDCNCNLLDLPANIVLVAISKFIRDKIVSNRPVHLIYDPFVLNANQQKKYYSPLKFVDVGIIGRITESKGLNRIFDLFDSLNDTQKSKYRFLFFGSYNKNDEWVLNFKKKLSHYQNVNYEFMGFFDDQLKLYQSIDLLLHLNENEPLGRILFECVNAKLPFLCSNKGGTGELAIILGLKYFTFVHIQDIVSRLDAVLLMDDSNLLIARKRIETEFSAVKYALTIEKLF